MNITEIELRRMLKQMLADEGINRETLKEMVREIISEKVDTALKQYTGDYLEGKINVVIRQSISHDVAEYSYAKVREAFANMKVVVDVNVSDGGKAGGNTESTGNS